MSMRRGSEMLDTYLLPGTDLVFTTTRHFARHDAGLLPLAIVESPIDFLPPRSHVSDCRRARSASPCIPSVPPGRLRVPGLS